MIVEQEKFAVMGYNRVRNATRTDSISVWAMQQENRPGAPMCLYGRVREKASKANKLGSKNLKALSTLRRVMDQTARRLVYS
ncbi:hypothetical protein N7491_004282 [Penicillium cf. griseofulvum]|nr:hypothetical protein N7491_004282 [Penicillium cf. griseofulvum]